MNLLKIVVQTSDINIKTEILCINRLLPVDSMINLPSFIINDYIDRTLDLLEERLIQAATRSMQTIKAISRTTTITGQYTIDVKC